jgi:hypothetical protein
MTPETETVAATVEAALSRHQPDGFRLNVRHDLIRHWKGRWWIVIEPDRPDVSANQFVDAMHEAQTDVNCHNPRWARLTIQLPEDLP